MTNSRELLLLTIVLMHCMGGKSGGGVLIQLAENRKVLEREASSHFPSWTFSSGLSSCNGGAGSTQSLMQPKRRMFLGCQQSRHSSTLGTPAAGG